MILFLIILYIIIGFSFIMFLNLNYKYDFFTVLDMNNWDLDLHVPLGIIWILTIPIIIILLPFAFLYKKIDKYLERKNRKVE